MHASIENLLIDFLIDLISTITTFTFLHTKITAFATNITSCMYIKIKVSEQLVSPAAGGLLAVFYHFSADKSFHLTTIE